MLRTVVGSIGLPLLTIDFPFSNMPNNDDNLDLSVLYKLPSWIQMSPSVENFPGISEGTFANKQHGFLVRRRQSTGAGDEVQAEIMFSPGPRDVPLVSTSHLLVSFAYSPKTETRFPMLSNLIIPSEIQKMEVAEMLS